MILSTLNLSPHGFAFVLPYRSPPFCLKGLIAVTITPPFRVPHNFVFGLGMILSILGLSPHNIALAFTFKGFIPYGGGVLINHRLCPSSGDVGLHNLPYFGLFTSRN